MAWFGDVLRRVVGPAAVILALVLTLALPEQHAHPATEGHGHAEASTEHDHHPEPSSASEHPGCHATVFCVGAVMASAKMHISPSTIEIGAVMTLHALSLASENLGFDPPPPRLS